MGRWWSTSATVALTTPSWAPSSWASTCALRRPETSSARRARWRKRWRNRYGGALRSPACPLRGDCTTPSPFIPPRRSRWERAPSFQPRVELQSPPPASQGREEELTVLLRLSLLVEQPRWEHGGVASSPPSGPSRKLRWACGRLPWWISFCCSQFTLHHPESEDLAFLYGTILTDGKDAFSEEPTTNICVFADEQVRKRALLKRARQRLFPFCTDERCFCLSF